MSNKKTIIEIAKEVHKAYPQYLWGSSDFTYLVARRLADQENENIVTRIDSLEKDKKYLKEKSAALELDLGLAEISARQEKELRESCEIALMERDVKLSEMSTSIGVYQLTQEELELNIRQLATLLSKPEIKFMLQPNEIEGIMEILKKQADKETKKPVYRNHEDGDFSYMCDNEYCKCKQ